MTVAASCALVINSAVEVRFRSGTALQISGTLDVNGTVGGEVLFTSDAAMPAAGDWPGLQLQGSSVVTIDHAEITYASRGLDVTDSATVTLTGVTSRFNTTYGMYIYGSGPPAVGASGCAFRNNGTYGVYVARYGTSPNPAPTISGSAIHSNGTYDYYAYAFASPAETVLGMRGNWWNSTDPAVIGSRIYDQRRNSISPLVDWGSIPLVGLSLIHEGLHIAAPTNTPEGK